MKIVGVGLGRTGTTSLHAALEQAGFDAIHYPSILDAEDFRSGEAFLRALRSHDAVANGTGLPYMQIDRVYPGCRFILTRRPVEAWLASKERYTAWEDRNWESFDAGAKRIKRLVREHVYGSFAFDAGSWRSRYEAHNAAVRAYFSGREDFLDLDLAEGFDRERFCAFLQVPLPEGDFPHVNSSQEMAAAEPVLAEGRRKIEEFIPEDVSFILVDGAQYGRFGRLGRPFLERNGEYWGRPADSRQAIDELERMRAEGSRLLLFPPHAAWWLEFYADFRRHLDERHTRLPADEGFILYELVA